MKDKIELVVFDIAGTTVKDNGEIGAALRMALLQGGHDIPLTAIQPLMGYKKVEAIKMLLRNSDGTIAVANDEIQAIHDRFLELMVDYYRNTNDLTPLPGAEEMFEWLHRHDIRIGLDTGFPKLITDVIMERLQWLDDKKVDVVVSSDEVPAGRPAPFMIRKIMDLTNVREAQSVIKVGDTEVDVQEGKNAGCRYSVAVTTGAFTREALRPYGPSMVIDSLSELIPIIQQF